MPASRTGDPLPSPASEEALFAHSFFQFRRGASARDITSILDERGTQLFSYRGFSSVLGIIAILMSGVVTLAGIAATILLVSQRQPLRGASAAALTIVFAWLIAMLVPKVSVTLFHENRAVLALSQTASFPTARWQVKTNNGTVLAVISRPQLSRIGRHYWLVEHDGRYLAEATERGFFAALRRKLLGKFNRKFETNLIVLAGPVEAARIVRRPENGRSDFLELHGDLIDRHIAVALATLVIGSEP